MLKRQEETYYNRIIDTVNDTRASDWLKNLLGA